MNKLLNDCRFLKVFTICENCTKNFTIWGSSLVRMTNFFSPRPRPWKFHTLKFQNPCRSDAMPQNFPNLLAPRKFDFSTKFVYTNSREINEFSLRPVSNHTQ